MKARPCWRSLITTPPRAGRWQGIRLFPFHGTKRTCSLAGSGAAPHDLLVKTRGGGWGSTPQTLGENKRRDVLWTREVIALRRAPFCSAVRHTGWGVHTLQSAARQQPTAGGALQLFSGGLTMKSLAFDDACDHLLGALLLGYAVVLWAPKNGLIAPVALKKWRSRCSVFDLQANPRLLKKRALPRRSTARAQVHCAHNGRQ